MTPVEKIYYNMDKLYDHFVDLPETIEARKEFDEKVKKLIPKEEKLRFDDNVTELTSANEKQGFMYGFQYAVYLLTSGRMAE